MLRCLQWGLFISFVPFVFGRNDNIGSRLTILEKKFAIQAYENVLMQEEFGAIKNMISRFDTAADRSLDKDKEEIEDIYKQQLTADTRDENQELNIIMIRLINAFEAEKRERRNLQLELKQVKESFQHEKDSMQSDIRQLKSRQHELENELRKQAENSETYTKRISDNIDNLKESFNSFMESDVIGQVGKLDAEIDIIRETVAKETKLLAKSNEEKLNSLVMNITNISKDLKLPQVSFFAKLSQKISHLDPWKTLVFDQEITNIGSAYSTKTGIFTAPTDGIYLFFTHVLGADRALEMCMEKNGQCVLWLYSHGPGHGKDGNMIILQLTKGDTMEVVKHGPWGSPPFYVHPVWTNFAGTMLYPL